MYKTTWAWPLTKPTRIQPIAYKQNAGAIGIIRFEPKVGTEDAVELVDDQLRLVLTFQTDDPFFGKPLFFLLLRLVCEKSAIGHQRLIPLLFQLLGTKRCHELTLQIGRGLLVRVVLPLLRQVMLQRAAHFVLVLLSLEMLLRSHQV